MGKNATIKPRGKSVPVSKRKERETRTVGDSTKPNVRVINRTVAEAPYKLDIHAPAPEAAEAAKRLHKSGVATREKTERAELVERLKDVRNTLPKAGTLEALNASELTSICKSRGLRGYSSLKKAELVLFMANGGVKPTAEKDSTRDLKERAAAAKKAGLISGPVSAAKKDVLVAAVKAAESGKTFKVEKAVPTVGTADHYRNLLRNADGKGYTAAAAAAAKKLFGKSCSALLMGGKNGKAAELLTVCRELGLVK